MTKNLDRFILDDAEETEPAVISKKKKDEYLKLVTLMEQKQKLQEELNAENRHRNSKKL